MNAEKYLRTEKILSQTLNGDEKLASVVTDFTEVLKKHNIAFMPETAFDLFCFTLETIHLEKLNISEFVL